MSAAALKGKQQILAIAFTQLLLSANIMYFYFSNHLDDHLPMRIVRFLLTCALLYAVYRGKDWARILLGTLVAISTVIGVFSMAGLTLFSDVFQSVLFLVMVNGVAAYLLLFSKDIKEYYADLKGTEAEE